MKRHRPPFNIRLRDDKSFPYIAVTLSDEYPRVMFTRERHRRGTRLLRPVREREEGARDARRAEPRVPLSPVRGAATWAPLRDPLPRLPHRPLLRAVHRSDLEGGLRLGRSTASSGSSPATRRRSSAELDGADARSCGRRALRGGRALPEPAVLDPAPRRPAGGRSARRRVGRRHRARDRRQPGGGAGLPAARREDDRPLRIPPRERRGRGRAVDHRGVRARVLRRGAERTAGGARPGADRGHGRARRVPHASVAARASSSARRCAARSAGSSSSRRRTRELALESDAADAERRPLQADRRARGAARGAQSREPARSASSASTSRTSRASRSSPR